MDKQKYLILCVAGQSNAVGYDESVIPADYLDRFDRSRIRQLGLYGDDNLTVIPLGACAQSYQDMRPWGNPANAQPGLGTKGIHLPLADLLLPAVPEDYQILVISCAYGGTGFTVGEPGPYDTEGLRPEPGIWQWGVQSPYYRGMKDRIAHVLDWDPDNKLLGVVWCQGEHDGGNAAGQIRGFEAMTEDFFSFFGTNYPGRVFKGDWNKSVWYNFETTCHWDTEGECPQIWAHYKEWSPETYIEIPRDTDTNAVNGTGLTASIRPCHFGNDAYLNVVAPRVAAVMLKRLTE